MFDTAEILAVLHGFNLWWSGRQTKVPGFERLAFHACRRLLEEKELKRAILLSGPRRVGKTTVLHQLASARVREHFEAPGSVLYLSLDHPLLKILTLPKILRLYHEVVQPEDQPVTLLLDEVQYASDWDLQLKQLVDHHPEYRIVATGSASLVHRQALVDSGVGRWITVPMPTLNFHEFIQIRGESPPAIPENTRPSDLFELPTESLVNFASRFRGLMPLFQRYLLVGGFPETALQTDLALSQRLLREDVVERVLKRDMTALFGIRKVSELEKLFIYLCIHSGDIFAAKTCADALDSGSPATVREHLLFLEQANLIYRLNPEGLGGKSILRARPKIYLVDAALGNAVLLRGEEILQDSTKLGSIIETTVLRHLYAYYYRDTPRIAYWRDAATGKEVDIIVKSPKYTIPVEVKYRRNAAIEKKSGLLTFCAAEKASRAYWVTQGEQDFGVEVFPDITTRVLKIPAHIFCYLLGQAERMLWSSPTAE